MTRVHVVCTQEGCEVHNTLSVYQVSPEEQWRAAVKLYPQLNEVEMTNAH